MGSRDALKKTMEGCHTSVQAVLLNKDLLPLIFCRLPRHEQGRLWQVCRALAAMKSHLLPGDIDRIKALVSFLEEEPPGGDSLFGHAGSVEALRLVPKGWLWLTLDQELPGACRDCAQETHQQEEDDDEEEEKEEETPPSPVRVFKEELLLPIAALLNCRAYVYHLRSAFVTSANAAALKSQGEIRMLATEWTPIPCAVYVALCLVDAHLQIHYAEYGVSLGILRRHHNKSRRSPPSFQEVMDSCQAHFQSGVEKYSRQSDRALDYSLYHGLILSNVHPMRDFALTVQVMKAMSHWHEHSALLPSLSVSSLFDCGGFFRISAEERVHFLPWSTVKEWINRDDSATWRSFSNIRLRKELNDAFRTELVDFSLHIENRLLVEGMYVDRLHVVKDVVRQRKRCPEDMTDNMPLWTERFLNLHLDSE